MWKSKLYYCYFIYKCLINSINTNDLYKIQFEFELFHLNDLNFNTKDLNANVNDFNIKANDLNFNAYDLNSNVKYSNLNANELKFIVKYINFNVNEHSHCRCTLFVQGKCI